MIVERKNEKRRVRLLERMVRPRLWVIRICIQMFLYKCKVAASDYFHPVESTIVQVTPLEYVSSRNNENLWQAADKLGSGKLLGWLSHELSLHPPQSMKTLFRPTSDGKYIWVCKVDVSHNLASRGNFGGSVTTENACVLGCPTNGAISSEPTIASLAVCSG